MDVTKTNYFTFPPEPEVESLTLRRATPADAAALATVGAATFLEAYAWVLAGEDIVAFCTKHSTPEAYAKYLAQPTTHITLALTGRNAPVGFAMVCAPDLEGFPTLPGDLELKRLYLFSRYRAKTTQVLDANGQPVLGLRGGQALMNAAIDSARAAGATRLLLGTNAGNQRAIAFYRKNGYEEIGTRTFTVGGQQCLDLIFALTL